MNSHSALRIAQSELVSWQQVGSSGQPFDPSTGSGQAGSGRRWHEAQSMEYIKQLALLYALCTPSG